MSGQEMRLLAVFLGFPVLLSAHLCQDLNQNHLIVTSTKCDSVSLSLPSVPSSGVFHLIWKKGNKVMARAKNVSNILTFRNGTFLFPNGTLLLYRPVKEDRGLFQLEIFRENGTCLFLGGIMLHVQDPVSKPVLSQISWLNGTVSLKCKVQRGDNVSIQWLERPCGTNSSWVRTVTGFTFPVEGGTSREFVCMAMNNVSQETSYALTVDCHDVAASDSVLKSGDEPTRSGKMREQIIVLLPCIFASLFITTAVFLVCFSITKQATKAGVVEKEGGTSFAMRDMQILDILKEEEYVDMRQETIAKEGPHMSSFEPMEARWNAQETETGSQVAGANPGNIEPMAGTSPVQVASPSQGVDQDDIYVPMNSAKSNEETVPASEVSQPATKPSDQEQVSAISSGKDRMQVVYAEVNFSLK